MNSNWRNRPTTIDYISKKVDWIIGIDESGNSNLKQALLAAKYGTKILESEKHFTVTACAINMSDFEKTRDMVMELKHKYWENALSEYKGIEKRVCFHSRDIRGRRGAFNPEIINYDEFVLDISSLMSKVPLKLFAANIDKERHVARYTYPDHPYDLCMNFVLERLMWNIGPNEKCIIVLEARGTKEDKALLTQIKRLIDHGNNFNGSKKFQKISGVYFNPKWCHLEADRMSYWELELADLCAYPIHKFLVNGIEDKAFGVIKPKINNYPNIFGYGLKNFP